MLYTILNIKLVVLLVFVCSSMYHHLVKQWPLMTSLCLPPVHLLFLFPNLHLNTIFYLSKLYFYHIHSCMSLEEKHWCKWVSSIFLYYLDFFFIVTVWRQRMPCCIGCKAPCGIFVILGNINKKYLMCELNAAIITVNFTWAFPVEKKNFLFCH